jgi:Lipocalin-like domain
MRPQPDFIREFVPGASNQTLLPLHGTGGHERHLIPLRSELDLPSVLVWISAAPNRVRLPTDDPFAGDPKLLALDAKGYLSYCGPFSIVSENEVIHHLKLCSFENWVGTD